MTPTEIIGALAATLTTIAFVPQVHKVLVHKDTHSLSLGMYVIFTTGVMLWGIYGYLRTDWLIITANAINTVLCMTILVIKVRNDVVGASASADEADAARH
jgi:MtN3 and saliva related transmembrane protein